MNYEDFYGEMQAEGKSVKDGLASLQKLSKGTNREMEKGDVKNLTRDLDTMEETARSVLAAVEKMRDLVSGFDTKEYFENGEFAGQMLSGAGKRAWMSAGIFRFVKCSRIRSGWTWITRMSIWIAKRCSA